MSRPIEEGKMYFDLQFQSLNTELWGRLSRPIEAVAAGLCVGGSSYCSRPGSGAQESGTKEGKKKKKKTPTTNTTSGALVLSELDSAPPTSGPRRRFLRFPEARPKHCACACQGRGLADQGRKTGKAGAGSRTGVASGPPPLDHPTPR